jgi:hypothetical protein
MVKQGIPRRERFSMFQTEMVAGQVGFGENSLYPTSFDGPGGSKACPPPFRCWAAANAGCAAAILVFVDIGFGMKRLPQR